MGNYPTLEEIEDFLDGYLEVERDGDDQYGIYKASTRRVRRIGLAIEPWAEIGEWIREEQLDALFLHRPWRLEDGSLPTDTGVLAYHLAFDLKLTFGLNPRLAETLGMRDIQPCAFKEGRALGMGGDIRPTSLSALEKRLTDIFGRRPNIEKRYKETIQRIAIVGAMTRQFVEEIANDGGEIYITGQYRPAARQAVQATGMTIAVIGHEAGERWGIRALGNILHERWSGLTVRSAE